MGQPRVGDDPGGEQAGVIGAQQPHRPGREGQVEHGLVHGDLADLRVGPARPGQLTHEPDRPAG